MLHLGSFLKTYVRTAIARVQLADKEKARADGGRPGTVQAAEVGQPKNVIAQEIDKVIINRKTQ